MVTVINTVRQAAGLTRQTTPLPGAVWCAFDVLNGVHRLWRSYRLPQVRQNPQTFVEVVCDWGIDQFVERNATARLTAQCILIATCISNCVEGQKKVHEAYRDFTGEFWNIFPRPCPVRWVRPLPTDILSPTTQYWLKMQWWVVSTWVQNVAHAFFNLWVQIFTLSMLVLDAVEAFYISPTEQNERIQDLFATRLQALDTMAKQQDEMRVSLVKNRLVVAEVLHRLGSQITVQGLEQFLRTSAQSTRTFHAIARVSSAFAHDVSGGCRWAVKNVLGTPTPLPESEVANLIVEAWNKPAYIRYPRTGSSDHTLAEWEQYRKCVQSASQSDTQAAASTPASLRINLD